MAKHVDDAASTTISLDHAFRKLESGVQLQAYHPKLDFGSEAVHLVKDDEFRLHGRARGWTWRETEDGHIVHHALIELRAGGDEGDFEAVAKQLGGKVQRGPFLIPRRDLERVTGDYVPLPAKPSTPAPPPPPVPTVTLASLTRAKLAVEKRLGAVLADRAARKDRLDRASSALKSARSDFVKNESKVAAEAIDAAESELRLAVLIEQAKPDAAPLERELAAANAAINALLGSRLHVPSAVFWGPAPAFNELARSYYGGAHFDWASRRPTGDTGHAVLAFDVGPCTRLELHERLKYRAIAYATKDGGWRVTMPFSRPVTDAEASALRASLGVQQFFGAGCNPGLGARIVEVDEYFPLDVDAALAAAAAEQRRPEPVQENGAQL